MAITLQPTNQTNALGKLQIISSNKLRRANRVKTDLDKLYIESETKAKANFLNLPYIDLYGFPIDTAHLVAISKIDAQRSKMGVFNIRNKSIDIATPSPGYPGQQQILTVFRENNFEPRLFLCSDLSFNQLLKRYNYLVSVKTVSDDINLSQDKIKNLEKNQQNLLNLAQIIAKCSVSEAVETILITAVQNDSSDIHFEPEKDSYHIRFRLDGVLHTFAELPLVKQKALENRLKILSGVKINVDNVPQDGRFTFRYKEKDVDVRVSMLPSNYGYSIVMRLLGTGSVGLDLDELGFSGLAKKRVNTAVNKSQGLILTTGPTGSGKTTTLYTFLKNMNDGEHKIITLEDPIEYRLSGVSQTQIDQKAGYTFASGLRSILRQDPDVVMVGEIRDPETAEIAIQASLTGHQVLSTIHTNDAAGSIPRLMEMNIKGFLLADSLSVVVGQRLVRRICPYCQQEDHLDEETQALVAQNLAKIPAASAIEIPTQLNFTTSKGCEKCNYLGYKGRIGVYEVLTITDGLRNILTEQIPSIVQIRQIAQQEGMITMLQDGILKALEGKTDMKEILKNIG
jgi:type IV pilus assembly protein PilB